MAVHPPRTTWTDERLDDLSQSVRDGFAKNDAEHRAMLQEMRDGFARVDQRFGQIDQRFNQIDQRFGQVDDRFGQINQRFDALQRTLIIAMAGLVTAVIAGNLLG